jgi:hypothetical protein
MRRLDQHLLHDRVRTIPVGLVAVTRFRMSLLYRLDHEKWRSGTSQSSLALRLFISPADEDSGPSGSIG